MGQEIVEIFTSMPWYIIVPLCVGVLLLFIECFLPDFGVFGILGLICLVGGIVANGIITKSIAQTLFLIALFIVVLFILFLIFIRSAKYGLLSKTPFVEKHTAVPVNYADKDNNKYKDLIGQRGVAITPFTPSGKFMIDDQVFDGITRGEALDNDSIIKVIDVEGNKILVEKVEV